LFTVPTKGVDWLNFGLGSLASSTPYDRLAMGYSGRQTIAPELPGVSLRPPAFVSSKRQSLQPSEEIQAIAESAALETHGFACCS
jgi:hypothetical protein